MNINLTPGQWLAIVVGILSATAGATAQLTPIFGATTASAIVSIANAVMTIIVTPFLFVVTGQSSQLKAVQAMPGVDKIVVNKDANQTLAALAVDDTQTKIKPTPEAQATVTQTAKGG